MPDLRLDLLDQHVAEAIAAARVVDTAIEADIIPNLSHLQRCHPKDVRKLLDPDLLFEARTLTDIEVLVETVERAILAGTTYETVHDTSPENVSAAYWTRTERDGETEDLYRALPVLHDLRDRLQAIQDLLATRRVLEAMNADI